MSWSPFVIGIAGGSGSGKSTLASALIERLGPDHTVLLPHDAYYRGAPADRDAPSINYDHPDSIDTALCADHLRKLVQGISVPIPVYDFSAHRRTRIMRELHPAMYIFVEGILVLAETALRCQMHIRVFVDTEDQIRFVRRMKRDMAERGRTEESVRNQWAQSVLPMHNRYVEPSKEHAHVVVDGRDIDSVCVRDLAEMIRRSSRFR